MDARAITPDGIHKLVRAYSGQHNVLYVARFFHCGRPKNPIPRPGGTRSVARQLWSSAGWDCLR
ncbi:MAG: hypothetical protein ACRD22_21525, partial [Terriglobia bacterium]